MVGMVYRDSVVGDRFTFGMILMYIPTTTAAAVVAVRDANSVGSRRHRKQKQRDRWSLAFVFFQMLYDDEEEGEW